MIPITIRDYDELVAALRSRMDEIGISYEDLEDLCGLTRGHISKVFGPIRAKNIGMDVLLLLMGGLALRARLEPDLEAAHAMEHRWERRAEFCRRVGIRKRFSPEMRAKIMSEIGRIGGSMPKRFRIPPDRRKQINKRNAKRGWETRRSRPSPSGKSQSFGAP